MIASTKPKPEAAASAFEFLCDKTGVPFVRLSCYLPPDCDRKNRLEVLDAVISHLQYLRSLEVQ